MGRKIEISTVMQLSDKRDAVVPVENQMRTLSLSETLVPVGNPRRLAFVGESGDAQIQ